jgi:biotin carboxyl carrier protein
MRRQIFFLRAGEEEPREVLVERQGSLYRVVASERSEEADAARLPDGRLSLLLAGGRQLSGRGLVRGHGVMDVIAAGRARRVPIGRERSGAGRPADPGDAGGVEEIRALMHGRIVEICVTQGDHVEAGAILLVLEAMKMQNEIRASRPGAVDRVEVAAGQTVEGGTFMVSIRPDKS